MKNNTIVNKIKKLEAEKENLKFRNQLLRERIDLLSELYPKRRKWYDDAMAYRKLMEK